MKAGYTHIAIVLDSSGSMARIFSDTIGGFNTFIDTQKATPGEATFTHIQFSSSYYSGNGRATRQLVDYLPPIPSNDYLDPFGGIAPVMLGGMMVGGPLNRTPRSVEYSRAYFVVQDFVAMAEAKKLVGLSPSFGKENTEFAAFAPGGGTPLFDTIGRAIYETGQKLSLMADEDKPEKVLFVIVTDGDENSSVEYSASDIAAMIEHQKSVYKWEFMYLGANQDAITVARAMNIDASKSMSYGLSSGEVTSTYNMVASKVASYRGSGVTGQSLDFNDEERKTAKIDP